MEDFLNWLDKAWGWICDGVATIVSNTNFWQKIYNIADFIGIVAGIAVSVIAIVTFFGSYYFKRIKILGWYQSTNIYDGHKFSVSIQNRSLSALAIKRVSVILDNVEEVVLFSSNTLPGDDQSKAFRSIDPFKTDIFTSNGSTAPLFEKKQFVNYKKIVFCFTYADESRTKVRYRLKKIKKNKYKTLFPKQVVFRSVRLTEHMMYIIERTTPGRASTQHIVFQNGMLDGKISTVSRIPAKHLHSADEVKQYLKNTIQEETFDVYPNPHYKQD